MCDDWLRPPRDHAPALADIREYLPLGVPQALRRAVELLCLPPVASGATARRFRLLAEVAAIDLSLGRLFEGHCDALDILRGAGMAPQPGVYGVWAAATDLLAATDAAAGITLTGTKPYCSGASSLDRALVTAACAGAAWLFDLDLRAARGLSVLDGTWPSTGMAASESHTLELHGTPAQRAVGGPGYYTERPGFWQGSLNVAACWFGAALGLARDLVPHLNRHGDAHRWAAFGALAVEIETMQRVLDGAAEATDRDPRDTAGLAHGRALAARQAVYLGANRAIELAAQVGGTAAFTHDESQSRRLADLPIYLRQHHPGPDMEALGRMTVARLMDD